MAGEERTPESVAAEIAARRGPDADHVVAYAVAQACREGVNEGFYGGDAPADSNVLTEVWPTRHGAGFTLEWQGRSWAVVVALADQPDQALAVRPDYDRRDPERRDLGPPW